MRGVNKLGKHQVFQEWKEHSYLLLKKHLWKQMNMSFRYELINKDFLPPVNSICGPIVPIFNALICFICYDIHLYL